MATKLFVFQPFPVQYHAPVYQALAKLANNSSNLANIKVFYATDATIRGQYDQGFGQTVAWDEPLLDGYSYCLLSKIGGLWMIPWVLRRERPTAVLLTQFNHRFCGIVYLSCLFLRIPLWIRMETQDEAFARTPFKQWIRRLLYRSIYTKISHCFAIGEANLCHYLRHGISRSKISYARYCVVDRFSKIAEKEKQEIRQQKRKELGLDDEHEVLLFCGKLQDKKNPECILDALELMGPQNRVRFSVLFVGSGEKEELLRSRSRRISNAKIIFAGFKNQTELPPYYLASDILILPSRQMGETWGLVVNEALLAGLRVVLSPHVGCLADFHTLPSVTTFDGTAVDLAKILTTLPGKETTRHNRDYMAHYTVEKTAQHIWERLNSPDLAIA